MNAGIRASHSNMKNIAIRRAGLGDMTRVQELSNMLGGNSRGFDADLGLDWAHTKTGVNYYRERLQQDKGVCFVAELEGRLVGFISCTLHAPDEWKTFVRAEIDNIFVEDEYRQKRVGQLLIGRAKQWAREIGAARLIVNAFAANKHACAFYVREGFTPYDVTLQVAL